MPFVQGMVNVKPSCKTDTIQQKSIRSIALDLRSSVYKKLALTSNKQTFKWTLKYHEARMLHDLLNKAVMDNSDVFGDLDMLASAVQLDLHQKLTSA